MNLNTLPKFRMEAAKADLRNRDVFQELVEAGMELASVSIEEMADKLNTPSGTITRWQSGHTAPTLAVRKAVIEYISSYVGAA